MVKRIVLENFMSHRRTVIEPAEGLTLLTGPNNCGKSAVVTALQILCSNESGASKWCVRHGQKTARVIVETSDQHRVEWASESGKVHYIVDGVRTDRLNRGLPDQLMPKLKLPDVQGDDGTTFNVHFATQKDPIFLLGSERRAATFFAASTDAGYLVKMQQLLRQQKSEFGALARDLKSRVAQSDTELERYEDVPIVEASLLAATKQYDELLDLDRQRSKLIDDLDALLDRDKERQVGVALRQALALLESPPALEDAESLRRNIDRLEHRSQEVASARAIETELRPIQPTPELEPVDALASMIVKLVERDRHIERLSARLECVNNLSMPEIASDSDLAGWIEALTTGHTHVDRLAAEVQLSHRDLDAARASLDEWLRDNPECPLCGGIMNADAVLAGGHVHA